MSESVVLWCGLESGWASVSVAMENAELGFWNGIELGGGSQDDEQ
jgi:hypothetical protein